MFFDFLFKPKAYNYGFLEVSGGHKLYFAEFGNPKGQPVLIFHGGPGGSLSLNKVKYANLHKYRVIAYDQRGAGASLPQGQTTHNTTKDLISDITKLLKYLKINQKIILIGGSWGSTLALLWAEQNPKKVKKLLLSQIFLADKASLDWELNGNANFYPEFVDFMQKSAKGEVVSYYQKLLNSSDNQKQLKALNEYGWFERICGNLNPKFNQQTILDEAELNSAKIYLHYRKHNMFLDNDTILQNADKIQDIPSIIIHNRLDFVCPVIGAYKLHQALPNSKLIIVPEIGHVGSNLYKTIKQTFSEELK